jgi:AraC-like DNA-binding protein
MTLSQAPGLDSLFDASCAMQGELFVYRIGPVRAAVFSAMPTTVDMEAFIRFFDASLKEAHVSLIDFSRMESVDQAAFQLLLHELEARYAKLAIIQKQVLVHPMKLAGAFVAGFFAIFVPPYPAEVVGDASAALERVGLADRAGAIETARAAFGTEPEWLRSMRRHLTSHLASATIDDTARAIGLSTRTLQRLLQGAQKTFSSELDAVRLRVADDRLRTTKTKIAAIAAELGFSSGEHFSEWFKRHRGERPSTYRER